MLITALVIGVILNREASVGREDDYHVNSFDEERKISFSKSEEFKVKEVSIESERNKESINKGTKDYEGIQYFQHDDNKGNVYDRDYDNNRGSKFSLFKEEAKSILGQSNNKKQARVYVSSKKKSIINIASSNNGIDQKGQNTFNDNRIKQVNSNRYTTEFEGDKHVTQPSEYLKLYNVANSSFNNVTGVGTIDRNSLLILPWRYKADAIFSPVVNSPIPVNEDDLATYLDVVSKDTVAIYTGEYMVSLVLKVNETYDEYYTVSDVHYGNDVMILDHSPKLSSYDYDESELVTYEPGDEIIKPEYREDQLPTEYSFAEVSFPQERDYVEIKVPYERTSVYMFRLDGLNVTYYVGHNSGKYISLNVPPSSFFGYSFGSNDGYIRVDRTSRDIKSFDILFQRKTKTSSFYPITDMEFACYYNEKGNIDEFDDGNGKTDKKNDASGGKNEGTVVQSKNDKAQPSSKGDNNVALISIIIVVFASAFVMKRHFSRDILKETGDKLFGNTADGEIFQRIYSAKDDKENSPSMYVVNVNAGIECNESNTHFNDTGSVNNDSDNNEERLYLITNRL